MWAIFKQDLQRWVIPQQIADPELITLRMAAKLLFQRLPVRAMLVYRFGAWMHHKGIPILPGLAYRFNYKRYGLEICNYNNIGGGLYIPHIVGTVLMPQSIGENCSVIASVTIGLRNTFAFPRIGNNVFIGAGARILGDLEIGDNVIIGANSVVVKDVPANATVVGVPARIIKIGNQKMPQADAVSDELLELQQLIEPKELLSA